MFYLFYATENEMPHKELWKPATTVQQASF